MRRLKSVIKQIKYKWKFRGLGVKFDRSCCFAATGVECEGMNVFHRDVVFMGKIGYGSYIGERSCLNAVIGRYCSISSDVKTISGTHPTTGFVSTHPCFFSTKKQAGFTYVTEDLFNEEIFVDSERHLVQIGNDVWIGSNVLILPGVHIGDGAVIAAGAVVTKDVEPYSIVGGVPAKIVRYRFESKEIRNKLSEIKWWNMPQSWIQEHADLFKDVDLLLNYRFDESEKAKA